jgi:hypothetical protein
MFYTFIDLCYRFEWEKTTKYQNYLSDDQFFWVDQQLVQLWFFPQQEMCGMGQHPMNCQLLPLLTWCLKFNVLYFNYSVLIQIKLRSRRFSLTGSKIAFCPSDYSKYSC